MTFIYEYNSVLGRLVLLKIKFLGITIFQARFA